MSNVSQVIEKTRQQHVAQARATQVCNRCRLRVAECKCGWLREGQVPGLQPPPPGEDSRREALITFIADRVSGLSSILERRGVSTTMAAAIVEVDRTTLHKWGTGTMNFRGSAKRLTAEQLERLVCLLILPSPPAPPLPESLRLRTVAGRLQLEMSATADRIATLELWAQAWPASRGAAPEIIRTNRSLVRLVIEGPNDALRSMRQELLAAERWRTLTPSEDDLTRWLSGGAP